MASRLVPVFLALVVAIGMTSCGNANTSKQAEELVVKYGDDAIRLLKQYGKEVSVGVSSGIIVEKAVNNDSAVGNAAVTSHNVTAYVVVPFFYIPDDTANQPFGTARGCAPNDPERYMSSPVVYGADRATVGVKDFQLLQYHDAILCFMVVNFSQVPDAASYYFDFPNLNGECSASKAVLEKTGWELTCTSIH